MTRIGLSKRVAKARESPADKADLAPTKEEEKIRPTKVFESSSLNQ